LRSGREFEDTERPIFFVQFGFERCPQAPQGPI